MDYREIIHSAWPEWKVVRPLGRGSYGSVYLARRSDFVGVSEAAIKLVNIPASQSELDGLRMEGLNEAQARAYLECLVRDFAAEVRLMESVKGYTNIVSIEDYKVVELPDVLQWHILIRMELLTPLNQRLAEHPMGAREVVKLGADLCDALSICRKKNIVHRDIKPENIFLNAAGDFKLGDFGVARSMERLTSGFTRTGTYSYMAPEVYNGKLQNADIAAAARVDIYSLGMVLYTLMNHGRPPFTRTDGVPDPEARSRSVLNRMRGDALPPPAYAPKLLAGVILTACAFRPEDRYPTAEALRAALLAVDAELEQSEEANDAPDRFDPPRWDSVPSVRSDPEAPGRDGGIDFDPEPESLGRDGAAGQADGSGPKPKPPRAPRVKAPDLPSDHYQGEPEGDRKPINRTVVLLGALAIVLIAAGALLWGFLRTPAAPTIAFADPDVEAAVREALGIPDAPLTRDDLAALTRLDLSGLGLENIGDLRQLTGLERLYLNDNAVSDLSPLSGLASLRVLNLEYNAVSDLTPLSGLASLNRLMLRGNRVQDVAPLSGLSGLWWLDLEDNAVTDAAPLSALESLEYLDLTGNPAAP